MRTLPIAKLVFRVCCALVLSGAIPDSSAADFLNTQSRKAHVLWVAGAQLPVRKDVQKNPEAITRAIEFAAREKADVLVTPEGSLSSYTHNFNAAATAQALEVIVQRAPGEGGVGARHLLLGHRWRSLRRTSNSHYGGDGRAG